MAENYTTGSGGNYYDELERQKEQADQELAQQQESGIVAANKAGEAAAAAAAENDSAATQAATEKFNAGLSVNWEAERQADMEQAQELAHDISGINKEPQTVSGNSGMGAQTNRPLDLEQMEQGLTDALHETDGIVPAEPVNFASNTYSADMKPETEAAPMQDGTEQEPATTTASGTMDMDELAAMTPPETPMPGNTLNSGTMSMEQLANHIAQNGAERQSEPAQTDRSGTMSMDELANHIAQNGPEIQPSPTLDTSAQQSPQGRQQEATSENDNGDVDDNVVVTDDTFGNQYKKPNFWDSDERKKETKTLADTFLNAKEIDDMIEKGGFALLTFAMNMLSGKVNDDYMERYNKEKRDFIKNGYESYLSDVLTKTGVSQPEYNSLLDSWVMHGAKDSPNVQSFLGNSKLPKNENGELDFSKFSEKQKKDLGNIMAEDPFVQANLQKGMEKFSNFRLGEKKMAEIIRGVTGNNTHVADDFLEKYGRWDAAQALAERNKAQREGSKYAEPTPAPAPEKGPATQENTPAPAPVNEPITRNAGFASSPTVSGFKASEKSPIAIPKINGLLKNQQPTNLSALAPKVATMKNTLSNYASKHKQLGTELSMINAKRNEGKTITPNGNTLSFNMERQ